MKTRNSLFLILTFFFISCKKDKLKGDQEILVGEWRWFSTTKKASLCDPPFFETELTPLTENKTYEMKFFERGKVEFYSDYKLSNKHRIVMNGFGSPCGMEGVFWGIYLDNKIELIFSGCVWTDDTLMVLDGFPFPDPDDGCEDYTSYFVRQL